MLRPAPRMRLRTQDRTWLRERSAALRHPIAGLGSQALRGHTLPRHWRGRSLTLPRTLFWPHPPRLDLDRVWRAGAVRCGSECRAALGGDSGYAHTAERPDPTFTAFRALR